MCLHWLRFQFGIGLDVFLLLSVGLRPPPKGRSCWVLAYGASCSHDQAGMMPLPGGSGGPDAVRMCVICMDAPRTTRFQPCQHSTCCSDCTQVIVDSTRLCPLCSGGITAVTVVGTDPATFGGSVGRTTASAVVGDSRADLALAGARARPLAERRARTRSPPAIRASRERAAQVRMEVALSWQVDFLWSPLFFKLIRIP
jgi:hypothetical protein